MAKSKILSPVGSAFESELTVVGGSTVPKVVGVRPCGSQVMIEFLTSQELLGTSLTVGVNEQDILLHKAKVVYETGPLTASIWKDAQELPGPWYVRVSSIESLVS